MSRRGRVAAVVSVGVFVASLDLFIVNIAFPDMQRDFGGASLAGLSWVLNAYAIVFAALLVPAGRWADRVGRKRTFLAGMALFTLASAACAAAPSAGALVAARVVQAAGAALLMPASLGLLLPEFPAGKRGLALGLSAAGGGAGGAAGPGTRPRGGGGGDGRRGRPGHRRAARRALVALGLPGQPAGRRAGDRRGSP